MKNIALKLSEFLLVSLLLLSCSKTETGTSPVALKDAIVSSSQNLNNTMIEISGSKVFNLLSVTDNSMEMMKAGTIYTTNIPLDLIKGTYDYKALKTDASKKYALIKFFTKTADPSKMIVNLPLAKIKDPKHLREYQKADSALTNNFTISVSNYYNNYNSYRDFDYVNVADVTIDKVKEGSLTIASLKSPTLGTKYASQFAFSNGNTAKYLYTSGDSIVSSFTIVKGTNVLYEEKMLSIKKDTAKYGREHQYILTIGDVKIVRKSGSAAAIYVNGTLQPKAVVKVIEDEEKEGEEHSICEKRDLQITFEDGTTSTISALIGKSITDIATLYKSLHQVYFSAYIVDWIGYDIFYKR